MLGKRLRLLTAVLLVLGLVLACAPAPAKVRVKFDIVGGDNNFAGTVYVQEVESGATKTYAYDPHTPYIVVPVAKPGTYVFYARLVEAPDDYHYGYTSDRPVAYGHMTRGGTQDPATAGLVAIAVKAGGSYKAYINDFRAKLPEPGKPVTVPWRPAAPEGQN